MSIAALIEAVEAGTAVVPDDFHESPLPFDVERDAVAAYFGSLDAAKALHVALLPGYGWSVGPWGAIVWLHSDRPEWDHPVREVWSEGDPARAWLLAILRAYREVKP